MEKHESQFYKYSGLQSLMLHCKECDNNISRNYAKNYSLFYLKMKFERHPLSALLPDLNKERLEDLKMDIDANGQRMKGIVYEGKVLDGWHRYLCTGEKFQYEEFKGQLKDAVQLVMSLNLQRRHLTDSQRMCLGAELTQILKQKKLGHNQSTPVHLRTSGNRTDVMVAKMINSSTGSISRATHLLKHDREKFEKCKNGEISVNKMYLERRREEDGLNKMIVDNIVFPDCYSHHMEIEKFLKLITQRGWGVVINIERGMFSACIARSNQKIINGEHNFSRAIVTALFPKREELISELKQNQNPICP
jgi:hypothetical protein